MAKTWAEIQAAKKPNTQSVVIVLDPEPGQRLSKARIRLAEAEARIELDKNDKEAKTAVRDAKAAIADAEAEQRAASTEFVFSSPGLAAYEALLDQHGPSPKQVTTAEEAKQPRPDWDKDTFPPALVAACCVQPEGFDETAAKDMWNDPRWSPAELGDLFGAAHVCCDRRQYVWDLGKESSETPT
jgi:hypothetical protein